LCLDGYIDKEQAILRSNNRAKMEQALQLVGTVSPRSRRR